MLITLPLAFLNFLILSTPYLLPHHTPFTLILCVKSKIASGVAIASSSCACMMPALLNMISTPPQVSTAATIASTSASLLTSHFLVSSLVLEGRLGRILLTLVRAVARAGSEISARRTEAPSRAKRMVVSRPMPLDQRGRSFSLMHGRIRKRSSNY